MADILFLDYLKQNHSDESSKDVCEQGDGSSSASDAHYQTTAPYSCFMKVACDSVFERQNISKELFKLFKLADPNKLTDDLPRIMELLREMVESEDVMIRINVFEHIPKLADFALECCDRVPALMQIISEHLLPIVVSHLDTDEKQVQRTVHNALFQLLQDGLVSRPQAEIQVCPTILALTRNEKFANEAITLMSKLVPVLGRDVVERVFLDRFVDFCKHEQFNIRRVCAAHFGYFSAIVGWNAFENVLLPSYIQLCSDSVWTVRKACAEIATVVSCSCTPQLRKERLAPAFSSFLTDENRWVRIAAFQTLGLLISTFADPPITRATFNNTGELVLVNFQGFEYKIEVKMCLLEQYNTLSLGGGGMLGDLDDETEFDEEFAGEKVNGSPAGGDTNEDNCMFLSQRMLTILDENNKPADKIEDKTDDESNINVIDECNNCDNLDSNKISAITNTNTDCHDEEAKNTINDVNVVSESNSELLNVELPNSKSNSDNGNSTVDTNNDTTPTEGKDEESLDLYNSYNYWYVPPDMPLDPMILAGAEPEASKPCDENIDSKKDLNSNNNITETEVNQLNTEEILNEDNQKDSKSILNGNEVENNNSCNNSNDSKETTSEKDSELVENNVETQDATDESTQDIDKILLKLKNHIKNQKKHQLKPELIVNHTESTQINRSSESTEENNQNDRKNESSASTEENNQNDSKNESSEVVNDNEIENNLNKQVECPIVQNDVSTECNNLDDLQLNDNENVSSLLFNETYSLSPEPEKKVEPIIIQTIVPQELIDHFVSMTKPDLVQVTDDNIAYHCAYALPAVVLTLGSPNWPVLKNTAEALAANINYKVRQTLASSLHELAQILGPDLTFECLSPIFDEILKKDLDEVRIGVLKHLATFLELMKPNNRVMCLPNLVHFLQNSNFLNWRFRLELLEQLLLAVKLFPPVDGFWGISKIAKRMLYDKVFTVRQVALQLVVALFKSVSNERELVSRQLIGFAERFAHSKKWKLRQIFVFLSADLLISKAVPIDQFASEVMPHLLDLSWDPVPNVRLVVARTISKHMITNEFICDPENVHIDGLQTVLRRLQTDKDQDVRYAAIVETPEPSNEEVAET